MIFYALDERFVRIETGESGGLQPRAAIANVGFEDTNIAAAAQSCGGYALLITASAWNERILRANGIQNVATVHRGIDPAFFHPGPRTGVLQDRFLVFTGGELAHRRGQDLVLLAFRAFAQRHPEAMLVTAWDTSKSDTAVTVGANPNLAPMRFNANGQLNVSAWLQANGIDQNHFIDLGQVPRAMRGRILSEMDVALFPGRCESSTNPVAMECMACGVPTILSDNTGHKDLIATGAPYPLTHQLPLFATGMGTDGWCESNVEEIVASLENAWSDREGARQRGEAGAKAMAEWNWRAQIGRLREQLAPYY